MTLEQWENLRKSWGRTEKGMAEMGYPKPSGSSTSSAQAAAQSAAAAKARQDEQARQEALIEQQKQAGLAAAQQGEALARQQLGQYGVQQQAVDQASLASSQQAQSALGAINVGGTANVPSQSQKIANLGSGIGSLSVPIGGAAQYAANMDTGGTGRPQNTFKLPSLSNIQFGGS